MNVRRSQRFIGSTLASSTDWKCNQCSKALTVEQVLEIEKSGKALIAAIEENSGIVDAVEQLEKRFSPSYHLILVSIL
jgi:ubiquitin C-terminal hydrolase